MKPINRPDQNRLVGSSSTKATLHWLGLPDGDLHELPSSPKRFPDGAQYRIEMPSVEGPRVFEAVLSAAKELDVPIHRISQGSGIMLLTNEEIGKMAQMGQEHGIEVSLFVGPRAGWDVGGQASATAGRTVAPRLRGADQLVYALEDVKRAVELGIRGVLVADEGLLWVLGEMRRAGELPRDLVVKVSVMMGAANPAGVKIVAQLGADTYNIPTDLSLPQIAAIRQVVDIPLDLYIEVPDDLGGFVRYYELPEIIRVAAPVYVKFGLRNAPNIYPSGMHLEPTAIALARERVRRASIALGIIHTYASSLKMSKPGAAGLAVPVTTRVLA